METQKDCVTAWDRGYDAAGELIRRLKAKSSLELYEMADAVYDHLAHLADRMAEEERAAAERAELDAYRRVAAQQAELRGRLGVA